MQCNKKGCYMLHLIEHRSNVVTVPTQATRKKCAFQDGLKQVLHLLYVICMVI